MFIDFTNFPMCGGAPGQVCQNIETGGYRFFAIRARDYQNLIFIARVTSLELYTVQPAFFFVKGQNYLDPREMPI